MIKIEKKRKKVFKSGKMRLKKHFRIIFF